MTSKVRQHIAAHLSRVGGATKIELSKACHCSISSICKQLRILRMDGVVYINDFAVCLSREFNVAPIYALGNKDDALPPEKTNCSKMIGV